MSYVRPDADAVTASWQGETVYSRPSADAVAGQWLVTYSASGFSSTTFGSPNILAGDTQVGDAASLTTTTFGTHDGAQLNPAISVQASLFGTHSIAFFSPSIPSAQFGTPSGQSLLRARSLLATSRFGAPLALFVDRTCVVSGFASSLGRPYGGLFTSASYGRVVKADPAPRSVFGQPSSPVLQARSASVLPASRFGAPSKGAAPLSAFGSHRSFFVHPASGANVTAFGAPSAASGHVAAAVNAAQFGAPGVSREQSVAATNRTRFGMPTADMTGTHKTFGFSRSWFGHPRALRDILTASGFTSSAFGEQTSYEVHRALHIPPEHKFGTPLMKRVA